MNAFLSPGHCYSLRYPAANYGCARPRLEARRVRVLEVRDTFAQPLEAATINQDPCLNRGHYLYRCFDLDKRAERSFYDVAMEGVAELELREASRRFSLVLFEPRDDAEPAYECDSIEEAIAWAEEWLKEPLGLAVAIQPPAAV